MSAAHWYASHGELVTVPSIHAQKWCLTSCQMSQPMATAIPAARSFASQRNGQRHHPRVRSLPRSLTYSLVGLSHARNAELPNDDHSRAEALEPGPPESIVRVLWGTLPNSEKFGRPRYTVALHVRLLITVKHSMKADPRHRQRQLSTGHQVTPLGRTGRMLIHQRFVKKRRWVSNLEIGSTGFAVMNLLKHATPPASSGTSVCPRVPGAAGDGRVNDFSREAKRLPTIHPQFTGGLAMRNQRNGTVTRWMTALVVLLVSVGCESGSVPPAAPSTEEAPIVLEVVYGAGGVSWDVAAAMEATRDSMRAVRIVLQTEAGEVLSQVEGPNFRAVQELARRQAGEIVRKPIRLDRETRTAEELLADYQVLKSKLEAVQSRRPNRENR
jgi:hypothetical protein